MTHRARIRCQGCAIFLSVLWGALPASGADSVKNAEDSLNDAYGKLYQSVRSGRGATPEDLKAVRNETVAPAVRDLDQAIVGGQISRQKKLSEKGSNATDVVSAIAAKGARGKGGNTGTSAPGRAKASNANGGDDDDDAEDSAKGAAAAPKGAKPGPRDAPTEGEFNLDGSRVEKLVEFEGRKGKNAAPPAPAAKAGAKKAEFEVLREESEDSSVTDGTRGEVIEFPGKAK